MQRESWTRGRAVTEVTRASTGGSRTVVLLRVVDRGSEELGTASLRRRWLSGILEDEQGSYPDEGARRASQRRGYRHGAVIPPGPFTVAGDQATVVGRGGADHVHVC